MQASPCTGSWAEKKEIETDLTIGIGSPEEMATQAKDFVQRGVNIIKIKLGKNAEEDVERVKSIREAAGLQVTLRIDANQGWDYEDALYALQAMYPYDIQFCEQPMRYWNDHRLPILNSLSPIPIMADESVFDHHDAERLLEANACAYVNIKFAKSGGILEAQKINSVCEARQIPCMMGGMLESRLALTAFAHFATAHDNIQFYDMDTCMLGHKSDPVKDGVRYNGFLIEIPDAPGLGADIDDGFLKECESVRI